MSVVLARPDESVTLDVGSTDAPVAEAVMSAPVVASVTVKLQSTVWPGIAHGCPLH